MNQNSCNRSSTPFEEFSTDIERMFDSLLGRKVGAAFRSGGCEKYSPQLDVVESAGEYIVSVDLPGVKPEDVKVEMDDGRLTISGKREFCSDDKTKSYHRVERTKGTFSRIVALPREVDAEKIDARFEQGVLHVTLPKLAARQPRQIEVRAQGQ